MSAAVRQRPALLGHEDGALGEGGRPPGRRSAFPQLPPLPRGAA